MSLSKEQQNIILKSKDHNILVDCVVGSGKTTTILNTAKTYPNDKFLLLTYNKRLRHETKAKATDILNIDIHSFHSFCYSYLSNKDLREYMTTDFGLLKLLEEEIIEFNCSHYDVIVIDEAQDLNSIYYKLCHSIIKDNQKKGLGKRTSLMIFGDRYQSIYNYNGSDERFMIYAEILFNVNKLPWSREVLSQTFRLNKYMAAFLSFCSRRDIVSHKLSEHKIRYHITNQFGNDPYNEIKYYISQGYSYEDIFILAPSLKPMKKLVNRLTQENIPVYYSDSETFNEKLIQNKLVFCTYHQSKGLERNVVIVFNFDNSYYYFYNKNVSDKYFPNEMYVAISRASERLSIIHHYRNSYLKPIVQFRGYSFLKILTSKVCDIINPRNIDTSLLCQYSSIINKDHTISVSVSNLLRHLSATNIYELMKFIDIEEVKETEEETEENKISLRTTISKDNITEHVSAINGIAIPLYYEYIKTGEIQLENIIKQKIYEGYKTIEPITFNTFIQDENEKIEIVDNIEQRILKIASKWHSISIGSNFKLNQIYYYTWISKDKFDECYNIMDKRINEPITEYESFHSRTLNNFLDIHNNLITIQIYGYIDAISDNNVWEFKCTNEIDPIQIIQLVLYKYILNSKKEMNFYLFNIFRNKVFKVSCSDTNLILCVHYLAKIKYFNKIYRNISDQKFVENMLML